MSHSHGAHSPHIPYDPLPLTHDPRDAVYYDPPSPLPSSFETPPVELTTFPEGMAPVPGARYFQGNSEYRDSFASHNTFHSAPSAPNCSVDALHANSAGAEFVGYQDDPGFGTPAEPHRYLEEKRSAYSSPRFMSKRRIIMLACIAAAIIVIIAVVLPIYFLVIKPKSNNAAASPTSTTSPGTGGGSVAVVTGGNGSTITTENGTTFTYINTFGGMWYWDPNDPFNNNAQPNSWTPPLNQTFNFGTDKIFGFVIFDVLPFSPPDKCLSL